MVNFRSNLNNSMKLIAKSLAQGVVDDYMGVEIESLPLASQVDRSHILNMTYLCRLAYIAYEDTPLTVTKLLTSRQYFPQYSFNDIHFLDNHSSLFSQDISPICGYTAISDQEIIVVLRGTKNIDDWLTNLLVNTDSDGIHAGFSGYANIIQSQLQKLGIFPFDYTKKLVLIGHSLGGAAVTLIAHRLGCENWRNYQAKNQEYIEVYTFGSPPVSVKSLTINAQLYRLRNHADLVPYLPQLTAKILNWFPYLPSSLSDYQHQWPEYVINQNADIHRLNQSEAQYFWNPYTIVEILRTFPKEEMDNFEHFVKALARYYHFEHRILSYIEKLNSGSLPPWLFPSVKPQNFTLPSN